ncbi:MAG: LysM peptidoglycan-binding domain-containing protein [Gammaproteobacteria bacterium]|jgi:membrane-bound lytic murein transglycosylase D
MMRRCTVLIFIFLVGYSLDGLALDTRLFPKPAAIEKDVEFWKRVYTEVTTDEGFIHDNADLGIIYEKVTIPDNYSRRARYRYVKKIKRKYEGILRTLSRGKRSGLSREEQRVLDLWPKGVSNRELRHATNRIRFQLGQANKFRAGLIRSGAWKPYILETLDKMGLPREIASLPHVESSFNTKAYSKVGAAGMWQFTRSTGRRFMRIDHIMDERMDPFEATIAAARLLENNYAVTGAWPLAMTAYNHGAAGMRRAARKLGTKDIVTVLRKYRSRTFGFASRNFYVAFLAAVEIDENPEKYFGNLKLNPPVDYEFVKLPGYMSVNTVMQLTNLSKAELKEMNPGLRPSVWNGNKHFPKGYALRINRRSVANADEIVNSIANAPSRLIFAKQKPDRYHRVRRGQTLSTIAARYGTSIRDLVALNNLRSRHRIRVGQVLRLPQSRGARRAPSRQVAENRSPKVEPRAIPASGTYRVRRGDTIESIARKYGVGVSEILAFNNIRNKNRIYPGQRLSIAKPEGNSYIVRRGDSIEHIADRFGVSISQVLALNNIDNKNRIYPGQKLLIAQPTGDTHIVQRGDSIDSIATRYGVSVSEILSLNNIGNKNRIYPGQRIVLAKAETSETTVTDAGENVTPDVTDEEKAIKVASVDADKEEASGESEATEQADETKVAMAVPLESGVGDESTDIQSEDSSDSDIAINDDEEQMKAVLGIATDETLVTMQAEGEDGVEVATVDQTLTDSDTNLPEDSESDAESISQSIADAAMSESDSELLADPTDYSVSKRNTIEVQAAETLGHYAEWLKLRASDLRRINRMRYGRPVVIGKRLKLKFSKVTPEEFEEQRIAYHRALQEEFFEQFQINGSEKHKIRRGQSVWKLAKRTYKIPIWLLRQYNPDLDMDRVRPGTIITFPQITERTDANDSNGGSAKSEQKGQKVAARASESTVRRRAELN